MSWFEASGFASIAKNALKEAQRTIDKALDIHEDISGVSESTHKSSSVPSTPGEIVYNQPVGSITSVAEQSGSSSSSSLVARTSSNTEDSISSISEDFTSPTRSQIIDDTNFPDWDLADSENSGKFDITEKAPNCQETPDKPDDAEAINAEVFCKANRPTPQNKEARDSSLSVNPAGNAASSSVEILSSPSTDDSFSIFECENPNYEGKCDLESAVNTCESVGGSHSPITRQPTSVPTAPTHEEESICSSIHSASTSSTLTVVEAAHNSNTGPSILDEGSTVGTSQSTQEFQNDISVPETLPNTSGEHLHIEVSSASPDCGPFSSPRTSSQDHSGHSSTDDTATSSDIEIISSPSLDGNHCSPLPSHASQPKIESSCSISPKSSHHGSRSSPFCNLKNDLERDTLPSSITTSFTSITESDTDFSHAGSSDMAQLENFPIREPITHYHERKGHFRSKSGVSETSESSLEHSEVDRLLKKISQLNEILEIRESKVLELSHSNSSFQENVLTLKKRVKELEKNKGVEDSESVREEYTQRLATMEKKFQQALREKEQNQKTIDELRREWSHSRSNLQTEKEIEEKNVLIEELRAEGEKLSKQQLNYSNITKKLRVKEKENDSIIKNQTKVIEDQTCELERLQRQLSAKDELERKQIEAIRQFTLSNQRQEIELKDLRADKEESEGKARTLKDALDTAYREIAEVQKSVANEKVEAQQLALNSEMAAKEKVQEVLQEEKKAQQKEKQLLFAQIRELQESLNSLEVQYNRKEAQMKLEAIEMERRLCEAENRSDEMSNAISAATQPLLKQLEGLQVSQKAQQTTWDILRNSLMEQLNEATNLATSSSIREKRIEEENTSLVLQKERLEEKVGHLEDERDVLQKQLNELQQKVSVTQSSKSRDCVQLETLKRSFHDEMAELRKEKNILEHQLQYTKTSLMEEKNKVHTLQENLKEKDGKISHLQSICGDKATPPPSPTSSRVSFSEDYTHSAHWTDDVFECSQRGGTLYDSVRGNSAVTVDIITSTLRQREGELKQLQNELNRNEAQKETLVRELVEVSRTVEELNRKLTIYHEKELQSVEMTKKYDALLQMYGEKVEELEELQLDLSDVKEMYKAQIDQLLQK